MKKLILIAYIFIAASVYGQQDNSTDLPYISFLERKLSPSEYIPYKNIKMKTGHLSQNDWRDLINSYWGEGVSTSEKLALFDSAWTIIDQEYAAFQNLDVDIDSLRDLYRPEIEQGVSRGRFAGIMSHFSLAMNEAHTILADIPVSYGTQLGPGVPLFVIGPWQETSWFGASLTPLPDSTAIVYRSLANHKLNLVAGDIVLGYDGVPWKLLYKELLEAELPILNIGVWGSTKESLTHCLLASVGMNWHLFDTIDIIKAATGDTLHLPTNIMQTQTGRIYGNEQLSIPGVDFPDVFSNDYVSWGIIDGTNIGYIYVLSWSSNTQWNISQEFRSAVIDLMLNHQTSGMIIDIRNNNGGWLPIAHGGYSLLFNQRIPSVAFDIRNGNPDHFNMIPHPTYTSSVFIIPGSPSTYYDNPIAVLTGPAAISNGDFESYRLKLHPRSRLFGKPSCGAFATSYQPDLGNSDWFFLLTSGNGYPVDKPGEYLTHSTLEIDQEVWLTKEGIVNGKDDVVNAAVDWINLTTSVNDNDEISVKDFSLEQNYPNPFNPTTKIKFSIPDGSLNSTGSNLMGNLSAVSLRIYDVLGREISTIINDQKSPGIHEVEFDGTGLPSGVYFYSLELEGFPKKTKKMLLLR